MTTVFTPEPRSTVKAVRHINYTCGPSRYAELETIAKESGIGLKELLRQMVDFSVAHYVRAQGMSAGTVETHSGSGPQDRQPDPEGDAPNSAPSNPGPQQ